MLFINNTPILPTQLMQKKYAAQTLKTIEKNEQSAEPTIDDLFLQKAKKVIDKHLADSIFDVEVFANDMNITPVQLCRKIKAITNQTVMEYVRNYRLEKAA